MVAPTRDRPGNLGMCPSQELNPQAFGVEDMQHATEPPGPGEKMVHFLDKRKKVLRFT